MTIECVDGQMATPHITGAQKGAMHAGVVGDGCYVLATGNKCKATQNSATSVTIGTGDLFIHGRHHQITAAETVTIQNGTQGQKRNDLICAVYHRDAQGIEQPTVTVLKGTPTTGTPADPTVPAGNVLNGDAVDYFPLYRVSLNGTTASAPVQLFKVLPTLATLGDSVSHVEVGDQRRIAFTPPADCDVLVLCAASGIWGFGGGTVTMSVDCPQLEAASKHVGKISGGNTEYHQLVSWGVFRGAKAGVTYSFAIKQSDEVGVMGDAERTALCMAVHL